VLSNNSEAQQLAERLHRIRQIQDFKFFNGMLQKDAELALFGDSTVKNEYINTQNNAAVKM